MKYAYFLLQLNKYTNFSEYPKESDRKATKKPLRRVVFYLRDGVSETETVFKPDRATLFRLVDFAQLLEKFVVSPDHLGTQSRIVLAHERGIVRLGGIVGFGEKVVANGDGLLHHFENLVLFRRLETNSHIAVENHLFQTVIDLFLQVP